MHDGVSDWGTLTTLAESPLVPGLIYVGSDDGRVARSDDDGHTWEFLEANLPLEALRATISRVTPSAHEEDRLYVAVDRHHLGDFAPYVFVPRTGEPVSLRSAPGCRGDGSTTSSNTPRVRTCWWPAPRWARSSPSTGAAPGYGWAGDSRTFPWMTSRSIRASGTSCWAPTGAPLHPGRQRPPCVARPGNDRSRTLRAPPGVRLPALEARKLRGPGALRGREPPGRRVADGVPPGGDGPAERTLEIRDSSGDVVARPAVEARSGFQRIVWDLRAGAAPEEARGACGSSPPRVPTGTYEVRLTGAGETPPVPLEVRLDPSVTVSEAAYDQRAAFLAEIHGVIRESCRTAAAAGDREGLSDVAREALRQLRPGGGFRNPSTLARLGRLYGEFTGDDVRQGTLDAPTMVHRRRFEALRIRLNEAMDTVRR